MGYFTTSPGMWSSVPEYPAGEVSISIIIESGGTIGGKLDTPIHPLLPPLAVEFGPLIRLGRTTSDGGVNLNLRALPISQVYLEGA